MQGGEKMHNIDFESTHEEDFWRSYSHLKIATRGTNLSLDDEQC